MNDIILLKLGEIVLKGLNRKAFERKLLSNIAWRLRTVGEFRISCMQSTVYVEPADESADMDEAFEACGKIFGVISMARAAACEKDKDAIAALAIRCLKDSGITAFFTRSSAANIPVNMELCEELQLDKEIYSVSIPLGATINMDGAAITISIMTLAAAHTLGVAVDVPSAIVLCVLSALAACGASGVAGGSLLLIPMACSMSGISNDVAMQVVAVGFIIGVVQDSLETALNSSGDVLFAATAEYRTWLKDGRKLPKFL